jgi:UTP:GlnB (protein PII) uridylyltransferase
VAVDLTNTRGQTGTRSPVASLIDRGALDGALRGDTTAVGAFREALRTASAELGERFRRNEPIEGLVTARAGVVDQIILSAWLHFAAELGESADLVAVGGYGRGELHPQSDIDLLILLDSTEDDADEAIGRFLTFLWDIGLEVGHSVRTIDDCEAQARGDVTVLTTLMETRLLMAPDGCSGATGPHRTDHSGTAPSSSAPSSTSRKRATRVITTRLTTSSPTSRAAPAYDIQMIGGSHAATSAPRV